MPARRNKDAIGIAGERHARMMLEAHGYQFLASNWHCSAGELDLVMLDCDLLVFVEVKTRQGERPAGPMMPSHWQKLAGCLPRRNGTLANILSIRTGPGGATLLQSRSIRRRVPREPTITKMPSLRVRD